MTGILTGPRREDGRQVISGRHEGGRLEIPEGERLRVEGAHLVGVDATGLVGAPGRLVVYDSVLEDCDFSGVDLSNVNLSERERERRTIYRRCRFVGTRLVPDRLARARFEECVFTDVVVDGLHLHAVDLVDNVFTGVLRDLTMWGRPPARWYPDQTPNVVRGNDFTGADLPGLALRAGLDVSAQQWPERPDRLVLDRLPERVERALAALPSDAPQPVVRALEGFRREPEQLGYVFFRDDPTWNEAYGTMIDLLAAAL